jgi:hypothetical protein
MGLELGLHTALNKLEETFDSEIQKSDSDEERELMTSARTWLTLYWLGS